MKTSAVRIYGKKDLRLETFDLPPIKEDEILAKVVADSLCMSSYKAASQAEDHKRVPDDIAVNPTIIGHEFCGELIEVGATWASKYRVGEKFSIQPALNYAAGPVGILSAPGYSYQYIGGDATYVVIPREVIENNCLLSYTGDGYYPAALAEPLSCVIGALHGSYHLTPGSYVHRMDIISGGRMALLAAVGPMGLAAIAYTLQRKKQLRPSLLVVTDIDQDRLDRAATLYSPEYARGQGVELHYVNTARQSDPVAKLKEISGGEGFNDVFVFAPVKTIVEQADAILAFDGCLNFFAGPNDPKFCANFNFYNVHYGYTHVAGTSGGNTDDMIEALELMSEGFDPAGLVTHIGGLNSVVDATKNLPEIPGGKKLIYTHIDLPLTPIIDFEVLGKSNNLFRKLADICKRKNGLWCIEAENALLSHFRHEVMNKNL